uniref:Uncharacterized protein n=1 Tax=Calcidiscus leptoporus TaxID=127549 RepID=A0A7S0IRD6_9EUKA
MGDRTTSSLRSEAMMHSDAFDGSGTVSSFSVTSNADCYGGGAWLGCKGRLVPADCVPSTWFDIAGSTGVRIAPPAAATPLTLRPADRRAAAAAASSASP